MVQHLILTRLDAPKTSKDKGIQAFGRFQRQDRTRRMDKVEQGYIALDFEHGPSLCIYHAHATSSARWHEDSPNAIKNFTRIMHELGKYKNYCQHPFEPQRKVSELR